MTHSFGKSLEIQGQRIGYAAALPGMVMHHSRHFRLSLTCTDAMLETAAAVFRRGGRR